MPERPLLVLPVAGEPLPRMKKRGGGPPSHHPSRERQSERLAPRFEQLQKALDARRAAFQTEARGLVPEEVVVLETIGTVDQFIRAVEKIPGMEWLSEIEEDEIPPDDDFFALDDDGNRRSDKALRGRLFMVFTNQEALRQMLSLWSSWQAGDKLPRGLGRWQSVFEQLRDVRPWGLRDRLLETGVLDDWRERVEHGQEKVPCEIELWFRATPELRKAAGERVSALVRQQSGEVVSEVIIEEIGYHALLASLPIKTINSLIAEVYSDIDLVQCEQIQFFRATGQMLAILPEDESNQDDGALAETMPEGSPVIALFDGMPLQRHRRLEGRLIIDDPDDFESRYSASERRHGTSMASLILHADLAGSEPPLSRPLYVRPILQPDSRAWKSPRPETVPESTLVVDLLHRAVRRLFEGEGTQPAVAPEVTVINLSIGIRDRLFDGSLSPLARLLDWLAWHYRVLFIVSAGNHSHGIELSCEREDFDSLDPAGVQSQVLRAVAADARQRRLLSPAEGVNALTVGALHADAAGDDLPAHWAFPYADVGLPSPINAQGMGYRRAIKPDVLAPGGRILVQRLLGTGSSHAILGIYPGALPPGQVVAAPGATPGDRSATYCSRGTSNATALVSRAAARLYDALDELRDLPGGEILDTIPRAIWLKALLAHSADWGTAGSVLRQLLKTPQNGHHLKEYLARLLGYGSIELERVLECTDYRATALSCGFLAEDQSHIHRFPLPPSLSGHQGRRKLTISLAWLTPVNPRHQGWRRADLWFAPPDAPLNLRREQSDWQATQRGTLQHEILKGDNAAVFLDGADLEIRVSCRAGAGALENNVPYALVTTLEVAEEIGVPIYDEIRVRIQTRVRVTPSPV